MDTPTSILALRPDLPPAVGEFVNRCLVKDPGARVQSVAEIGRVLAPFGTQRGGSRESIDRNPAGARFPAGYPPVGAPTAAPGALGTSSPARGGAPGAAEAATAPMPHRPDMPSSPGSEVAGAAHATLPHASWGNTTRTRAPRSRVALLAGAAAALVLAGFFLAWRLTASGSPDSDSPVASSSAAPEREPVSPGVAGAVTATPTVAAIETASAALEASAAPVASASPDVGAKAAASSTAATAATPPVKASANAVSTTRQPSSSQVRTQKRPEDPWNKWD